jgi:major membrane immunogen (membrane-anchored lipoprotein)
VNAPDGSKSSIPKLVRDAVEKREDDKGLRDFISTNVSDGKPLTPEDIDRMIALGIGRTTKK